MNAPPFRWTFKRAKELEVLGLSFLMLKSKALQFVFGCAISVVLLLWLVQAVNWPEVMEALRGARYIYFLPMAVIFFLHFLFRAIRWKYLLPANETSTQLRYDSIMIGNVGNFFLPLRAGEFLRPLFLSGRSSLSFPVSFISIVLERFFDLSCVLIGFSFLLFQLEGLPDWVFQGASGLCTLAVGILVFIFVATRWPLPLERFVEFCLRPLNLTKTTTTIKRSLIAFSNSLIEGAGVLRNWKHLSLVVVMSLLVWLLAVYFMYLSLCLFDNNFTLFHALTVTVIVALAVAAPSAPGFVGVYQVACVASFTLFGLSTEVAAAFAIVSHVFQYVFFLLYLAVMGARGSLGLNDFQLRKEPAQA